MTIKPGIKPASPASVVACRHAKQRSKLNKSHFRLVVKVMPLFIWFVLLNVCVSRKVKMPWSTRREQKPVCTSVGSPNHCLKFKKGLIYSNTFIWLKCWVFMNKHVDVFRINNLQFNYINFIFGTNAELQVFCIVSSNRHKNILDCVLIHIKHIYTSASPGFHKNRVCLKLIYQEAMFGLRKLFDISTENANKHMIKV